MLVVVGMPSHEHELIVMLFHDDPQLVIDLLRLVFGLTIPDDVTAVPGETSLSEAAPAVYNSDGVVVLRLPSGKAMLAVVVEVQRAPDDDKQWSWPAYLTKVRRENHCPGMVLVIATNEYTAARAREPIVLDPFHSWTPCVVGPPAVPRVVDPEEIRRHPEMGVLSALVHRETEEDIAVLRALYVGLPGSSMPDKLIKYVWDVILSSMGAGARAAWERFMEVPEGYQYQSDFAKKYYGQGRDEGIREGRDEGIREGRDEGVREGIRRSLARLLGGRGIALTAETRATIDGCQDLSTLEGWLDRATTAVTITDIFRPGGN